MADENFRELEQEEAATGIVDAGDFEDNAGTGAVAEEQETAGAVDAPSADSEDTLPIVGGDEQNIPPMPSEPVEEAQSVDLHEDQGSGLDIAVIIVVLLIIIAGLSYAIWSANNAPVNSTATQQTVAQQQAAQQASSASNEPPFEVADLPGGVAAVVNGEEIPEADIDEYVSDFRKLYDLTDDDAWAEWMVSFGYTADSLRNSTIQMFVEDALVRQAVAELDVQASDEQVQEVYDATRSSFETEEDWQDALEGAGLTDETFREQCVQQVQQRELMKQLAEITFSDEELDAETLDYIKTYYPEYADATSLEGIDAETVEPIREMMDVYAQQQAYNTYLDTALEDSDIKMSAAPKDLPYSVNLLPYYFQSLFAQAQATQQQSAQ